MVYQLSGHSLSTYNQSADLALSEHETTNSGYVYRTYSYKEDLFVEFDRLVNANKQFDGLIVDLMHTGYTLPLEIFVKFHSYAQRLLRPQGVMLFVKADGALALAKDDPAGSLTFSVYDSPVGIFARYPMLADYVCATISGIDRRRVRDGDSTLANHILYTSVPVLTDEGKQAKEDSKLLAPYSWVIQLVDDYSTVESIATSMERQYKVQSDEFLRILQELEWDKLIYPIFSRLQFLSSFYHNRKPFRLGRYMVAARLLNAAQLQELLDYQQGQEWGKNQKISLGLLALRHGYINSRQLEVMLNDQYMYGGYYGTAEEEPFSRLPKFETMRDSMIGSLNAIDGAGLLQSLAGAKKTGLLTIENRDKSLMVSFDGGLPTHAKLHKLQGYNALLEFLSLWTEGVFVFRDKARVGDLEDACKLNKPLYKMLMNAALAQDQMNQILSELPGGRNVILERINDFDTAWQKLSSNPLKFMDDAPVTNEDKVLVGALLQTIDGLTSLGEVIESLDSWSGCAIVRSVKLLLDNGLLFIQKISLFKPLTVFQKIAGELEKTLGQSCNLSLLRYSLKYICDALPAAGRFEISDEGRISVNIAQMKASKTSITMVLLELRRWMEAYLAHCRCQITPEIVNDIVVKIVHDNVS